MKLVEFNDGHMYDYAIRFNETLNPKLFDEEKHMHPVVRERLLDIAKDFKEFLGVEDLNLKDITISGSNAAYTYTPHSDIDLHLVVDIPKLDGSNLYRELFDAKKFQYNTTRNIKVKGYDVELYVQDAREPHISLGIYSVLHDKWVSEPEKRKANIDDLSVQSKVKDLMQRIDRATEHKNLNSADNIWDDIKEMRKTGLHEAGEFSPENLAFKILRNNGYLEKLNDYRASLRDEELSLEQAQNPL